MKRRSLLSELIFLILLLIPTLIFGSGQLFTLTPLTPTTIQIPANGSAIVQYRVQNQSSKPHTLTMAAIAGVTQITNTGNCPNPFVLGAQQSCILTLQINGNQIITQLVGGPVVCQQAPDGSPNPQLCYQPSLTDILNITTVTAAPLSYLYAGTQNGNVFYSVNNGLTWTPTTSMPAAGSPVNSISTRANLLYIGSENGYIYYSSNLGNTWNITTQPDGSAVKSIFTTPNAIYAGTANGNVVYSTNGINWISVNQPDGSAVNSVFATTSALYAGTANGSVYYSTNNGTTWAAINGQPDGSAIVNIYVANNILYVDTANEYVYTSTALSGSGTWTTFAQSVYSLFVDATGNNIYAGSQSGYVFSLTTGTELGFVTYSPVNSIYTTN